MSGMRGTHVPGARSQSYPNDLHKSGYEPPKCPTWKSMTKAAKRIVVTTGQNRI